MAKKAEYLEAGREVYIRSLSVAEVTPMMEANRLFKYVDADEIRFCINMAHLYGCVPLEADGDNLYNFLATLYHYGVVQGIRAERARRKGAL